MSRQNNQWILRLEWHISDQIFSQTDCHGCEGTNLDFAISNGGVDGIQIIPLGFFLRFHEFIPHNAEDLSALPSAKT
jgi:hypothetical protein